MSEEGDRPMRMQALDDRSTESCVDAVEPTGSKRASPEALTAHSGISTTDPEASTDFALPLLEKEEAPSSSSKEERILSPRPNVSAETGADFVRSSFSTRGLRVNDGMGEVNGSDLSDKHVVIGWFE
jgi:hypothetical protein